MPGKRFVVDTGIIVSATFWGGTPGRALETAISKGTLVFTEATSQELATVFGREKFDPFATLDERAAFLLQLARSAHMVTVATPIVECEDPNDDMILEAAFYGQVDCVIASDKKIKKMHPFRGIPVLTPSQFLSAH